MRYSQYSTLCKTKNWTFVCLLVVLLAQIAPAFASRGPAGSEGPGSLPQFGERFGHVRAQVDTIKKNLEKIEEDIGETKQTMYELRDKTIEIKTESKNIKESIDKQTIEVQKLDTRLSSRVEALDDRLWYLVAGILLTLFAVIGTAIFPTKRNR